MDGETLCTLPVAMRQSPVASGFSDARSRSVIGAERPRERERGGWKGGGTCIQARIDKGGEGRGEAVSLQNRFRLRFVHTH